MKIWREAPVSHWLESAEVLVRTRAETAPAVGREGVGESATVGAPPAIANAVVDSLAHLGVRHVDIPITPEKGYNGFEGEQRGVVGV